jgi:hypothetical protein
MEHEATHWSSPDSAQGTAVEVQSFLVGPEKTSDGNAKVTAKGRREVLPCGFMCHGKHKSGRTCRKVVKGHIRGAVCPECMEESVYFQCANGCLAYVHVGCADSAPPWTCPTCRAKPEEAAEKSQAESESESAGKEPTIDEPTIETMEFENYTDCHAHLRDNHFVVKKKRFNKQMELTHVDYICEKSACHAKLTVKRRANSEAWAGPLLVEHQVGTLLALPPTSSVCTITTDCLFRQVAGTEKNSSKKHSSP